MENGTDSFSCQGCATMAWIDVRSAAFPCQALLPARLTRRTTRASRCRHVAGCPRGTQRFDRARHPHGGGRPPCILAEPPSCHAAATAGSHSNASSPSCAGKLQLSFSVLSEASHFAGHPIVSRTRWSIWWLIHLYRSWRRWCPSLRSKKRFLPIFYAPLTPTTSPPTPPFSLFVWLKGYNPSRTSAETKGTGVSGMGRRRLALRNRMMLIAPMSRVR